ncbi:MAG: DNA-3-methyladenine glycosylase I [Acidobacteriota bacterium]
MKSNQVELPRCLWGSSGPMLTYHDTEWGVPLHDDRGLFEFLILEGAQAGLSWATILAKRENYRTAFAGFDPVKCAKLTAKQEAAQMKNVGIVRNRLKIASVAINAKAFIEVKCEFGTFDEYIWQFVNGEPLQNNWKSFQQVPARTLQSDAMSKDLKRRGFKFIGSTICYAFMQAVGMVNDHVVTCYRHEELR